MRYFQRKYLRQSITGLLKLQSYEQGDIMYCVQQLDFVTQKLLSNVMFP